MKKSKLLKYKAQASLTVEAAMILPIFIFAIISFIYFMQILQVHNNLQEAITNVGLDSAKYGYVYESYEDYKKELVITDEDFYEGDTNSQEGSVDSLVEAAISKSINSAYFKKSLKDKLDKNKVNVSCIKNGFNGVHTYLSTYMDDDQQVDIILNYWIEMPFALINLNDFQIVQRVKLRGWSGYRPPAKFKTVVDEEDLDSDIVFITATGKVYHISRDCTHIKLSIEATPYNQIQNLRNKAGGKYIKCYICGSDPIERDTIYITTSGDRYHTIRGCSGLKRTVIEIPRSQVNDKTPCKRCG